MSFIEELKEKIRGNQVKIVFPEGEDRRILRACARMAEEGIIEPIVLGKSEEVKKTAEAEGVDLTRLNLIDVEDYAGADELVEKLVERRKGKLSVEEARELIRVPNYMGTMLVYIGAADGMVSGAVGTTGDTVRPALQIIKTKPGVSRTSGAFIMLRGDEMYYMADCAINIELDAQGLGETAVVSEAAARQFGMDPSVAMLSFSTKGSASHELVDKVVRATEIARELNPDMKIDGELQFDAAFVPEVAAKKAPGSNVAGNANVFIFPSLDAGNIGYKLAQRFGGFEAIGPILQGLNKPVNDLSRGCVEDEVISLAVITAAQAVL